jgi:cardiolipin synthase
MSEEQKDRATSEASATGDDSLSALIGAHDEQVDASDRIFTVANVVSFIRLFMIPIYFVLLLLDYSISAALVFGLAAATDCVDGQIARRTNTVTKLGKVLDPAVDRLLMIMGVLGVFVVGRLPLWIIMVVLIRDLVMLVGGSFILDKYGVRIDVIFPGKVVTTLLFVGFFGLMMNWPLTEGLGVTAYEWLPGLCAGPAPWGIWCVYVGLIMGLGTTTYYIVAAVRETLAVRRRMRKEQQHGRS